MTQEADIIKIDVLGVNMVNVYAFYINIVFSDYETFLQLQMYSNKTLFLVVSGLKLLSLILID